MTFSLISTSCIRQVETYIKKVELLVGNESSENPDELNAHVVKIKNAPASDLLPSLLQFQQAIIERLFQSAPLNEAKLPVLIQLRQKTQRMIETVQKVHYQLSQIEKTRLKVFLDTDEIPPSLLEGIKESLSQQIDLEFTDTPEEAQARFGFNSHADLEWTLSFDNQTFGASDIAVLKECLLKKIAFVQKDFLLLNRFSPLRESVDLTLEWTDTKGDKRIHDEQHPLKEGEMAETYWNRNDKNYTFSVSLTLANRSPVALYATIYRFDSAAGIISRLPAKADLLAPGKQISTTENLYCQVDKNEKISRLFYMAFFSIQPHDFTWIQQTAYKPAKETKPNTVKEKEAFKYPPGDWTSVGREIGIKTYQMKFPENEPLTVEQRLKIIHLWKNPEAISDEIKRKFITDLKERLELDPSVHVMIGTNYSRIFEITKLNSSDAYYGMIYRDNGEFTRPSLLSFHHKLSNDTMEVEHEKSLGNRWQPLQPEDLLPF